MWCIGLACERSITLTSGCRVSTLSMSSYSVTVSMFNKDVFIVFNVSDDKITKGFRFLVFVALEICVFMQGFCVLYNNG